MQFWRQDPLLKTLSRDPRWAAFHRACGQDGLFFDDIAKQRPGESTWQRRRREESEILAGERHPPSVGAYQAVSYRIKGDTLQAVSRGTGQGPVEAVIATYHDAIERGDPVSRGLESILLTQEPTVPVAGEIDIMELIG